ncbi:DUF1501 domain-containing protein [Armatimonas sp.]|uniref:DUF1501 domain-containing protein n=1 Tax=Armatimonas sp. TaxID=1872638 RepID=UPI00374D24FA
MSNQKSHACHRFQRAVSRRELLQTSASGFGMLALAGLLADEARAENPLAVKKPHFAPKAKRVIFLFMHGGPSQVDTFDPKPLLTRDSGKPYGGQRPRVVFAQTGNLLGSPWKFNHYGKCGTEVSDLFPHVAQCVDEMCVIRSLHGSNPAHGGALLKVHTGTDVGIRPSMGSWAVYGLGTENQNLPGYVTICPTLGHGGVQNWSSAFLPPWTQGTPIGNASVKAKEAKLAHLGNADATAALQRLQLDNLHDLDSEQLSHWGVDPVLEGRIQSFELAFRMQVEAPKLMDISKETQATLDLYGIDKDPTDNFGRQCLLARRFCEAGVRFVQVTHSYKWDQHGDLKNGHTKNAAEVDKPIAGLLRDLKQRGLLEDTLVLWGGEFGRTPTAQGGDGRDHNPHGFTMWMAGGGVNPGTTYGSTDDYGWFAEGDKCHIHDLHATMLHLLGIDHTKLTYRYAGRDYRLTDVEGIVAAKVLKDPSSLKLVG